MSWTPDYLSDPMLGLEEPFNHSDIKLSPAMVDVLDKMRDGWELGSRTVPPDMGKPGGERYWLSRPRRRNSPRIGVERVTVEALRRRGLI